MSRHPGRSEMNHSRPQNGRCAHRTYNLTCEEFDQLTADHEGRCALCHCTGPESARGVLVIDHDYRLGQGAVRGLLCSRCNTVLDVPNRERTPEEEAYLADPWWRRRLGRPAQPARETADPALAAAIETATRRYMEADAALEEARQEAVVAVIAALRDKIPPTTVTEKSPFTATYVRQLARGAGIPAATTRRPPQRRSAS